MPDVYKEGSIVKGKVTAVKPYGVFVKLDETHHGLVHISQISEGFVKDINQYVKVDDEIDVKIISIDEATGKISLSIKEAKPESKNVEQKSDIPHKKPYSDGKGTGTYSTQKEGSGFNTLEDQLKVWLKQSKERQDDINKRNNR
jgi:general stress protein 13